MVQIKHTNLGVSNNHNHTVPNVFFSALNILLRLEIPSEVPPIAPF